MASCTHFAQGLSILTGFSFQRWVPCPSKSQWTGIFVSSILIFPSILTVQHGQLSQQKTLLRLGASEIKGALERNFRFTGMPEPAMKFSFGGMQKKISFELDILGDIRERIQPGRRTFDLRHG